MNNPAVLLIGGPETGKSNFLFRTWTHIDSSNGTIEKDGLPADAEYLRTGAELQLRGMFAGRTPQEVQVISRIPIRLRRDSQKKAVLLVPDINGERINQIYHERKWSADWESLITEDTAYLFFVRIGSEQTVAPLDWITWHKLYCDIPQPTLAATNQDSGTTEPIEAALEAQKTPTQVILVDWLQFILAALRDKYPQIVRPRVGIVVTAWDCVANDFLGGPLDWIGDNMPLIYQYCISNHDGFEFSFLGSSIFSGDPTKDPEFAEQLGQKDPRIEGYVLHSPDNIKSGDFTIPITWALGW